MSEDEAEPTAHIYLRRKLSQAGARPLIRTVRGAGYVLREP